MTRLTPCICHPAGDDPNCPIHGADIRAQEHATGTRPILLALTESDWNVLMTALSFITPATAESVREKLIAARNDNSAEIEAVIAKALHSRGVSRFNADDYAGTALTALMEAGYDVVRSMPND